MARQLVAANALLHRSALHEFRRAELLDQIKTRLLEPEPRRLAGTDIPPERSSYGTMQRLHERTERQLRGIVEAAARAPAGGPERKVGDLYSRTKLTPFAARFLRWMLKLSA